MMTRILRVSRNHPEPEIIREAAEVIQRGELVAFPTETVYGLGADALNEKAVEKIFQAKHRPADNPLIVHIARKDQLSTVALEIPEVAWHLIDEFWPGPLTLIFKRDPRVPRNVCRNLPTVAVRMPADSVALALIEAADTPIAAPSANLSGRPSPTTAEHVLQDFEGIIPLILDAGPCPVGVESTVIDIQTNPPRMLRPGGLPAESLLDFIPQLQIPRGLITVEAAEMVASPGMKYRHYSPECKLVLFVGNPMEILDLIDDYVESLISGEQLDENKLRILCLHPDRHEHRHSRMVKGLGPGLSEIQRQLFRVLRDLDVDGIQVAVIEGVPEKGEGLAIMNRLYKAAHEVKFLD